MYVIQTQDEKDTNTAFPSVIVLCQSFAKTIAMA